MSRYKGNYYGPFTGGIDAPNLAIGRQRRAYNSVMAKRQQRAGYDWYGYL